MEKVTHFAFWHKMWSEARREIRVQCRLKILKCSRKHENHRNWCTNHNLGAFPFQVTGWNRSQNKRLGL